MLPLVLALVISVGPDNELNRTEILEVMTTRPTGACGVGNPWVDFVNRDRAHETNALLMNMSADAKLSAEQRSFALEALGTQKKDETVCEFFRRRFAQSNSEDRRHTALFLLELSDDDRATVLRVFDTGDLAFDRDVLQWLQFGREKFSLPPATLARIVELYERAPIATDDVVKLEEKRGSPFGSGWKAALQSREQRRATAPLNKAELVGVLVRFSPEKYVPLVLRSKDAAQIDHVYGAEGPFAVDDLVAGLEFASEGTRERLDDHLARAIVARFRKGGDVKALMNEWSSPKRRAGLNRAPLAAYSLGTGAESQRDFTRAQKLYDTSTETAKAMLVKQGDLRSPELEALLAAIRAQQVGVLVKQKKTAEATRLSQGLMASLRDNHSSFTVLENDSVVDTSESIGWILKADRSSAE